MIISISWLADYVQVPAATDRLVERLALAGLNQATGTWDQCLQGFGVLTKDKFVCDAAIYT